MQVTKQDVPRADGGLVLRRKSGETIHIGDNVVVQVGTIRDGRVSLRIQAPPEVRILRGELPKAA